MDRAQLLQPGLNCWRVENTHRLAPIVDAAAYFRLVRDALLRARHSVLFIGWEFDTRIKLDPSTPLPGLPDKLGAFLSALIDRRPGLQVRVLQWNLGLVGTLVRGTTPLYLLNWISRKRFDFRLDSAHPPGAAHHQKIVVIDDALAFCGGIDMTDDRWDTRAHKDDDPHRVRPSGRSYGAFHDVTMAVDGAAAKALGDLARERWRRATGEKVEPAASADPDLWPADLTPLSAQCQYWNSPHPAAVSGRARHTRSRKVVSGGDRCRAAKHLYRGTILRGALHRRSYCRAAARGRRA